MAVIGCIGLALVAWLALEPRPPQPVAATPRSTSLATPEARSDAEQRRPLVAPVAGAPPGPSAAPGERIPGGQADGGEDHGGDSPDAAFARKYAGASAAELEAAVDELAQRWHETRAAKLDAALAAGRYASHVVAPADLEATLRSLSDAATREGQIFSSRTLPFGQGAMLEVQFVTLARGENAELFAVGDEVRWLEQALERVRREDDER